MEVYPCKFCRKSYFKKQEAKECESTHILDKKLTCRRCGKGFTRRSYLHEHMMIHEGKQPYSCNECKKKFTSSSNLVRHKRIHSGEKPHGCAICGQKFTLKKNMVEHVRTHTGEKPFECPHCGASFARRSSLVRHTHTHTNVKSFKCQDCGKGFKSNSYLNKHVATHMKPIKQKVPRKHQTKEEIARDEKEKILAAEKSSPKGIIDEPKIKIEEDDNTTTWVFLPTQGIDMNFIKEGMETAEEEVQQEPLQLTKYAPIRPYSVIVAPQSGRLEGPPLHKPLENEPVQIKEEICPIDLEETVVTIKEEPIDLEEAVVTIKEEPIDLEEAVVTTHRSKIYEDIPHSYGTYGDTSVVKFNNYYSYKIEEESTIFQKPELMLKYGLKM